MKFYEFSLAPRQYVPDLTELLFNTKMFMIGVLLETEIKV